MVIIHSLFLKTIAISFGKLGLKLDVVVRWPLFIGAREPRFDCTTIVCFFNF